MKSPCILLFPFLIGYAKTEEQNVVIDALGGLYTILCKIREYWCILTATYWLIVEAVKAVVVVFNQPISTSLLTSGLGFKGLGETITTIKAQKR